MSDESSAIVEGRLEDESGAVGSDLDGLEVVGRERHLELVRHRRWPWESFPCPFSLKWGLGAHLV